MTPGASMTLRRLRLWWWRRGGRDRAIVALGFTALLLALFVTLAFWLRVSALAAAPQPPAASTNPALVRLTLVRNAKKKGAVCLDGSPPGYHLQRGFGSGKESWLIFLEGGGWCSTVASCTSRKMTALGSSRYMERQVPFVGILSNIPSQNPDFYNWNKVRVRYCDGASYSGNVKSDIQNGTKLFFRGQRIWEAIMDELLMKGLANAKQAFLTGCSAGGLAALIHCEDFHALLPEEVTVKCLSDAGFFLDEMDISKRRFIRSFYDDVVRLQDVGKKFQDCLSRMDPSQCFFAREIIKNIHTPLFILNPAYDVWQIQHILAPESSDNQQSWLRCKLNVHHCDSNQIESLQGFRAALLNALSDFQHNKNGGIFINSCFIHCQTMNGITWHSPNSPRINNKTIAEAVGDWYFNRREVKEIDCAYPCNPTCINLDLMHPFKMVEAGLVIWDPDSRSVAADGRRIYDVLVPGVELRAAWEGITCARSILRVYCTHLEGDLTTVLRCIQNPSSTGREHPLLQDICRHMMDCVAFQINHVYREANRTADWVASYIAQHSGGCL